MAKFDWTEFLSLAKWFSTYCGPDISHETLVRNEVSRAYYGLLGRTKRYLIEIKHDANFRNDESELCKAPNIHAYVQDTLKKSSSKDERELGEVLSDMREWRNIVDYHSRQAFLTPRDESIIRNSIELGQKLFEAVSV